MSGRPTLTVASFYSGAGGLDLGFEDAGYEVLLANDIDATAIKTLSEITQARLAVAQDVSTLNLSQALPDAADVVIGGPPCQGFSVAGKMDPNDPRNRHLWTFLSLVSQIKPRAFVLENVKNLYENARWSALREDLLAACQILGYSTRLMLLNAADFGVPQTRERMFLVGMRGQVSIPPLQPDSSAKKVTVREALSVLPRYGSRGNDTLCSAKITPAAKPVLRKSPYAGMLFNGAGRPLDLDRPSTTLPASMGGNRTPIIEQNMLDGDSESWIKWYHQHLWQGGEPLALNDPVSPHLRRLTVEEAAVLQGFPPGTRFAGKSSAQFRQIGNSVAPPMARAVATYLAQFIDQADESFAIKDYDEGELIDLTERNRPIQAGLWDSEIRLAHSH